MKILIVTNMWPHEGNPHNGIFVYEQVKALEKYYSDVYFDVYFINGTASKIEYLKSIICVNKKIQKGNYDIVHVHFGLSGLFLLWPIRKKIPTLITFHGSDIQSASTHNYWMVKISKIVAQKVDAAVVLNDKMEALVNLLGCKTYKIPCAVNTQIFTAQNNQQKETRKKISVVFPSDRTRQVKDYPLFKKTIEILRLSYGLDIKEYELKNMGRKDVALLYARCDVLLLTSKSEGSPQVIKEAMSCNLPCVCTPVGDVNYLLEGVRDCYVAKNHDAHELADLTMKSLKHIGNGISGREKIHRLGLDELTITKRMYNLYCNAVQLRGHVQ
jgi:glycosyltransferase involved in cell wall biosynthesis